MSKYSITEFETQIHTCIYMYLNLHIRQPFTYNNCSTDTLCNLRTQFFMLGQVVQDDMVSFHKYIII